jgi:hypothetical protein
MRQNTPTEKKCKPPATVSGVFMKDEIMGDGCREEEEEDDDDDIISDDVDDGDEVGSLQSCLRSGSAC